MVFHTEERLSDDYTLMDVAYIYTWRRVSSGFRYNCCEIFHSEIAHLCQMASEDLSRFLYRYGVL